MKIFTATLATETNTFSVAPTGWSDFAAYGINHGNGSVKAATGIGMFHAELHRLAAADGHQVIESLSAFSQPSGRTLRVVYETLRDEILKDLQAALPVNAVQLILHGAMVAEGYDDCEGDLLSRVRKMVGPKVAIGVELDLHCHYTELMRRNADIIICYKEYPHTDALDRLREMYRLTMAQAAGRIRAVTAVHDCRMVGIWPTTSEPLAGFVRRLQALEGKDGVLSVSLGYGFPWGDVPESGAKLWVITDNDLNKAAALAKQLAGEFWDLREQVAQRYETAAEALQQAGDCEGGPVVLADSSDNPGGGAMSDSTFILKAMLDAGTRNAALGFFWDLAAVHLCRSAGVGSTLNLRIGGKCGPASGDPVDLRVQVRAILEAHSQPGLGAMTPMGTVVWVQADHELDIVLNTFRGQVFSPEPFTALGIDVARKKIMAIKSSNHFLEQFAPIAKKVIFVKTPGTKTLEFDKIPYRNRDLNYWPRVANPF